MGREPFERFTETVGYSDSELTHFTEEDPRKRLIERVGEVAHRYSIEARVIKSRHCYSGLQVGDRFILDTDGNFITKLCPKRMCVYAVSQLTIPVALINERISEGLDPNEFHFMKQVRCTDVGPECKGYGEVMMEVNVIERER